MLRPAIIAHGFEIPVFVIFDGDRNVTRDDWRKAHARDNVALLRFCGENATEPFPNSAVWGNKLVMWPENIGSSVQPDLVASLGEAEFGAIKNAACLEFDNEGKLNKTALYIGQLLTLAKEKGAVCPSLDRLADSVLAFGAK